jgi:hypothetical protein
MRPLTLDEALCTTQAVPAILAMTGTATPPLRICAGILVLTDLVLGFGRLIGLIVHDPLLWILGIVLGGLGIAVAAQCRRPIVGTLLVTTGVLEAFIHLHLIALW